MFLANIFQSKITTSLSSSASPSASSKQDKPLLGPSETTNYSVLLKDITGRWSHDQSLTIKQAITRVNELVAGETKQCFEEPEQTNDEKIKQWETTLDKCIREELAIPAPQIVRGISGYPEEDPPTPRPNYFVAFHENCRDETQPHRWHTCSNESYTAPDAYHFISKYYNSKYNGMTRPYRVDLIKDTWLNRLKLAWYTRVSFDPTEIRYESGPSQLFNQPVRRHDACPLLNLYLCNGPYECKRINATFQTLSTPLPKPPTL